VRHLHDHDPLRPRRTDRKFNYDSTSFNVSLSFPFCWGGAARKYG
jgi:hypothetical protein